MRTILNIDPRQQVPDHIGLAYDVWAPVQTDGCGKVSDDERGRWLERLEGWTEPEGYADYYGSWLDSLRLDGSRAVVCQLQSRLLLGHGNPAPSEVGLSVHHTWGTPIIHGSAIKGLLAHYVDAVFGPEEISGHPLDSNDEAAKFRGVTWEANRIAHGPGQHYRSLFGAPDAESDRHIGEPGVSVGACQGVVQFHDALFVPAGADSAQEKHPFVTDVLTPHQKTYYRSEGKDGEPNDYDDPTPISFLTVRPKTRFLIALSGDPRWTKFALDCLRDALVEWGVGGKVNSGYGRIVRGNWQTVLGPEVAAVRDSSALQEFSAWIEDDAPLPGETEPPVAAKRLEIFKERFLARLQALSFPERQAAAKLLLKKLKAKRVREEVEKIAADLKRED